MKLKSIKQLKVFLHHFISCAACLFFIFGNLQESHAALDYGVGRIRECIPNGDGTARVEGMEFDPRSGGKDVEFVLSNEVCLSVIATSYTAVKLAIANMNRVCGTGRAIPRITPSPIKDVIDIGRASAKAIGNPSCAAGVVGGTASLFTALAELAIIYNIADNVNHETHICGAEWMLPSSINYNFSVPGYKQTVQNEIEKRIRENDTEKLSLGDKTYREWFFGGVEVEDYPEHGATCLDPTATPSSDESYPPQKYYLKGLEAGNFNCKKYLINKGQNDPVSQQPITESRLQDFKNAYDCCIERSRSYICISAKNSLTTTTTTEDDDCFGNQCSTTTKSVFHYAFCKAGEKCKIHGDNDVVYISKSLDNDRLICAETYSLCPYNFSIGGGTEYCDYYQDGNYDKSAGRWKMITAEQIENGECKENSQIRNSDCTYNEKAGKCQNYCQYLAHCTTTSYFNPYVSNLSSPYFSEACLNFEGDSQNKTKFDGGILIGNQRHFSAPIAQCVKETLENLFYNRAGHSKCLNVNEYPDANGDCPSGLYVTDGSFIFKKGNKVKQNSLFQTIQDSMQFIVKLVLTFSIMFYGMNLLLWKADIRNKKDILIYLLKIGLVLYFATGDAWQTMFFNGVYGASAEFSRMVFKIKVQEDENKRDGCQFGRIYLEDGTEVNSENSYPQGKEYLSMWDTLDCKMMRYLGFGPEASGAKIAFLILATTFTGVIGVYFSISITIFGMLLIAATIRALHIFLSSVFSIIILVFISPIIIPLVLFEKTKKMFDDWLSKLIIFSLQPMILFAYIAIFVTVIDQTLLGSASFRGPSPSRTIDCEKRCVDSSGNTVPYVNDQAPACDEAGQKIIDPMNDSVACLLEFDDFGKFPGLEFIGISLPVAINLLSEHTKERVLTILKGALVMYVIYKFMDQIPSITAALVGDGLSTSEFGAKQAFKKTIGFTYGFAKRAGRGGRKLARKSAEKGKDYIRKKSDKGTKIDDAPESGADDADKQP